MEEYGLDSILVVQLTNTFRDVMDGITSTLFFEVHTIDALGRPLARHARKTHWCAWLGWMVKSIKIFFFFFFFFFISQVIASGRQRFHLITFGRGLG